MQVEFGGRYGTLESWVIVVVVVGRTSVGAQGARFASGGRGMPVFGGERQADDFLAALGFRPGMFQPIAILRICSSIVLPVRCVFACFRIAIVCCHACARDGCESRNADMGQV